MTRACSLLLLAVAMAGCGEGEDRPRPAKGKVGDRLTATAGTGAKTLKLEIRLLGFARPARPTNEGLASTAFAGTGKDPAKYDWARVRVRVTSHGPQAAPLAGESFLAIDEDDQRYEGVDVDPGGVFEPDATGQPLEPGDSLQGFVAIPIPKRARIVAVRYASVSGGTSAEWRVAPSRAARSAAEKPVPRWRPGERAYTVVLLSSPDQKAAEQRARTLLARGADAGVLRSDDYSSFPRGLWIVWRGRYRTPAKAQEALNAIQQRGLTGYVTYVMPRE